MHADNTCAFTGLVILSFLYTGYLYYFLVNFVQQEAYTNIEREAFCLTTAHLNTISRVIRVYAFGKDWLLLTALCSAHDDDADDARFH